MSWHRIASLYEVEPGGRKTVDVEGKALTLLHGEEGMWCIDARCPHTGGPLGSGEFVDGHVICPLHKWKFDLGSGVHQHNRKVCNPDTCKPAGVYQLKVEGESLLVEL